MSGTCTSSDRGVFTAEVSSNRQIGGTFYKLRLVFGGAGAKAFAGFRPGQFVQIDISHVALPSPGKIPADLADASKRQVLLRRPFSFTDVTGKGDKTSAELLYCVVGPATLRMTTLSAGDSVSVVGPLGNGFWVPDGKRTALLVVGGMGAPPLELLAKKLTAERSDIEAIAFAGAKTANELPFEGRLDEISQNLGFSLPEFAKYGVSSIVATDDGSAGYRGLVTDCVVQWLTDHPGSAGERMIYACGPEEMLAAVAGIAGEKNIDCQVSMERRMACGTGLCQSCAVECKGKRPGQTIYKLCCKDGPVFDAKDVVWRA
jgi:dihydroorotate dehydrogenase electron transfer subunit